VRAARANALARGRLRASAKLKPKIEQQKFMGKLQPRSFERIRSGEQIQIPIFTNVAAAAAAGITAVKFPRRMIYLTLGLAGGPCLAISDGTVWKAIPVAGNAN
jgi:hypothetical protein